MSRRDAARASRRTLVAIVVCCGVLVSIAACDDAGEEPLTYDLSEHTMTGGRIWILVEVPRAYTAAQLREVFESVRAENLEPEHGVFVAIKCETGDDEVGADRLAFGRYAVGRVGAAHTQLADGEADFSVFEGRTCAPRTAAEEARANRPAERADAYALEKSSGIRTGCGSAAPVPPAQQEPGCIYVAARSGCLYALDRSQANSRKAVREKIATPALLEIYEHAVDDCGT